MLRNSRLGDDRPDRMQHDATPAQKHAARRELLFQISNFLLDLDLAVDAGNLTLAQEVVSGTNPTLSRQIAERQLANEPITQAWLDDVISEAERGKKERAEAVEREALSPLMSRLDQSLELFVQNAAEAGGTAGEYYAALVETATSLNAIRPVVELPALAELTRTMLERIRIVEEEMRRRKGEAAALQDALKLERGNIAMDNLIGMDSHRTFDEVLEQEFRTARETSASLSIAFCSIDHFQAINDAHGPDTGNRLIQVLARGLKRISAHSCHVAHHGEQFILLFRGLSPDQARLQLDEVRQEFARRKLIDRETEIPIGTVTFSGGVADVCAYNDPRAALKAAEEALAETKGQGANIILVAAAPTIQAAPAKRSWPPR